MSVRRRRFLVARVVNVIEVMIDQVDVQQLNDQKAPTTARTTCANSHSSTRDHAPKSVHRMANLASLVTKGWLPLRMSFDRWPALDLIVLVDP